MNKSNRPLPRRESLLSIDCEIVSPQILAVPGAQAFSWALLVLILLASTACNRPSPAVPAAKPLAYENHFLGQKVKVEGALADKIRAKLDATPDGALKNTAATLDTRKYVYYGNQTFQATENELILMDSWGFRSWKYPGIAAALDSLLEHSAHE